MVVGPNYLLYSGVPTGSTLKHGTWERIWVLSIAEITAAAESVETTWARRKGEHENTTKRLDTDQK